MNLVKSLLLTLAVMYLAGCNTTATPKEPSPAVKSEEEKVIVIPPLKDLHSLHNKLRYPLPYQYKMGRSFSDMLPDSIKVQLTGENLMELQADTTTLHIKGDSCWLEYVTAGRIRAKKKDGGYLDMPTAVNETTDTVRIQ